MSTLITTAISYVNGPPHLGHALELIYTDALARSRRSFGDNVHFLTGTDENSLKNVRAAEELGVPTQVLVDRHAELFRALAVRLGTSHDDFIRTTEPRHRARVEALWQSCRDAGDFYRAPYRGLYCVGCEQFYTPDELTDGLCPEHLVAPELVEEENWFFKLSKYSRQILEAIEEDRLRILPESAKQEALAFARRGLVDFSVSRSFERARGWGIPVPGDPRQIIYVWFDALANYLAGDRWSSASERVQVIGKGITRFHALYWPGILLSAGLPLPSTLVVHGYLTVDGKKIGKSLGNVVDPAHMAEKYGVEALRYWLLRHVRYTGDADFREASLVAARDAELADQLGNLVQRTVRLIELSTEGVIPDRREATSLLDRAARLDGEIREHTSVHRPDRALGAIFEVVEATNVYLGETAPWKLTDRARLESVLGSAAAALAAITRGLAPFLPATAAAIRARLTPEGRVVPGPALFPKQR